MIGTYQEVLSNSFTKEQAKSLLISAVNLESNARLKVEMNSGTAIPNYAPSHPKVDINENIPLSLMTTFSSTDKSTRTATDTTGIGYEVKSNLGYNRTTSFLTVGDGYTKRSEGEAGYMFNTIYYSNTYQDIGIGYINGKWCAIASGNWTLWINDSTSINTGDRLYFRLWIGTDGGINFQILDGNNFNNIIFEKIYSTNGRLPSSGSGVGFNRQITLVDTLHNPTSGIYLKNASFDQAYLYNNTSYSIFNDSNTASTRRGKFGCTWASDSKVTIISNTHWSAEKVTLIMQ